MRCTRFYLIPPNRIIKLFFFFDRVTIDRLVVSISSCYCFLNEFLFVNNIRQRVFQVYQHEKLTAVAIDKDFFFYFDSWSNAHHFYLYIFVKNTQTNYWLFQKLKQVKVHVMHASQMETSSLLFLDQYKIGKIFNSDENKRLNMKNYHSSCSFSIKKCRLNESFKMMHQFIYWRNSNNMIFLATYQFNNNLAPSGERIIYVLSFHFSGCYMFSFHFCHLSFALVMLDELCHFADWIFFQQSFPVAVIKMWKKSIKLSWIWTVVW